MTAVTVADTATTIFENTTSVPVSVLVQADGGNTGPIYIEIGSTPSVADSFRLGVGGVLSVTVAPKTVLSGITATGTGGVRTLVTASIRNH